MASDNNENVQQGRPPDPSPNHISNKNKVKFHHHAWSYPNENINNNNNEAECSSKKQNNSTSLKEKLFCIKKTLDEEVDLLSLGASSKLEQTSASINNCDSNTIINNNNNATSSRVRARTSLHQQHQDVEEALNSLLWQPYEYQKKATASSSASSSSCTSCSSASSDLDEFPANKGPPSSRGDLNLRRTEMVNNLKRPAAHQWCKARESRDALSCCAASRLNNSQASLLELEYIDGTVVVTSSSSSSSDSDYYCDVFASGRGGDMQLEVSGSNGDHNNIINIATTGEGDHDGLIRNHHALNHGTVRNNSNNNGLHQQISLSSANVVGLPENPRRAAVPPTTNLRTSSTPTTTGNLVFPSQQSTTNLAATNKFNSNIPVVPQHSHNGNLIAHLRSASVPKSMNCSNNGTTLVHHQRINSADNRNNHNQQQQQQQKTSNVSNINVNFYRAVPVNVVSSVPTIQCLNTLNNDEGNSVSNVHIMPLGNTQTPFINSAAVTGTTQVTVHNTQTPTHSINVVQNCNNTPSTRTRTFTSTEAQTDEISVLPNNNNNNNNNGTTTTATTINNHNKRKERRERRHHRRNNNNNNNNRHTVDNSTQVGTIHQHNDRLPDLLSNHMPPPYSPLPSNVVMSNPVPLIVPQPPPPPQVLQTVVSPSNVVAAPGGLVAFPPPQVPLVQNGTGVAVPVAPPSGFRFPFPAGGFRRARFSDEPPKGCCGLLSWKPGSLRWFIAVIALVAVCCVLVGTALGAMRPAGRDHLTVSLLMIGVGIVLVTVSGVAWRLTSHDSSTCRSMLGLGSTESVDVCTRRFVPRLPPSYGRPHHPYAAMMYPEFQYRPPPPSYQASMQEYRLRLLLLDRGNTPQIQAGLQNAVSPPPTYRSHAGSLLRAPLSSRRGGDLAQSEYSCPPSYRSQTSTNRPGTLQNSVLHSREQSLSLSDSNNGDQVVNVVNILGSTEHQEMALDNITLDSLKMEPESDLNPLKMLLKGSSSDLEGSKDGNLVTIVQTSDQNPVIVTVSGMSSQIESGNVQITEISPEMEILAHL